MSQLIDDLLDDQRRRWESGAPRLVDAYLADHPELAADDDAIVDLLYNEFVLRSTLGQAPSPDDYYRRFPLQSEKLREQLAFWELADVLVSRQAENYRSAAATLDHCTDRPPDAHRVAVPPSQPPLGNSANGSLNGFTLLGELGHGAMGVVYRAYQEELKRPVAVKMLHVENALDPEKLARFRREAEIVARLQHPNIVQIHAIGEHDGRPYFTMELVNGINLAEWLKQRHEPIPPHDAAALVETLARAIHHAHQRGIIHRDLKPANILLSRIEDRLAGGSPQFSILDLRSSIPKVTDFGLAKLLDHADYTRSGGLLGTPVYMAPEQVAAQPHGVGPAADIYALGVLLYELLTQRVPFPAQQTLEVLLEQIRIHEPELPSHWNSTVPRDLDTICQKCLEKDPSRRYVTADALADDLKRFLKCEPILASPVGRIERARRWCRRNPLVAGLLIAITTASLVAIIGWMQSAMNAEAAVQQSAKAAANEKLAVVRMKMADAARRQAEETARHLRATMRMQLEREVYYLAKLQDQGGPPDRVMQVYQSLIMFGQELRDRHGLPFDGTYFCVETMLLAATLEAQSKQFEKAMTLVEQAYAALAPYAREFTNHPTEAMWLVNRFGGVATALRHKGGPLPSLLLAEKTRAFFEPLYRKEPTHAVCGLMLSQAWTQIAKNHWQLGHLDETSHALRQSLEVQRQVCQREPDVPLYRHELADRHIRLGRFVSERGKLTEAVSCFLEARKLTPDSHVYLSRIAQELKRQAQKVGEGRDRLTPAEHAEQQRYLSLSAEAARAALALRHTVKGKAP
jgi:serine/threonine protein kinase